MIKVDQSAEYMMLLQSTYYENNVFSFSNDSTYDVSGTAIVSLELFNDTGLPVLVQDAEELFEIEIDIRVS